MDTVTSIDVHTDSDVDAPKETEGCKDGSLGDMNGKCDPICLMLDTCQFVCISFNQTFWLRGDKSKGEDKLHSCLESAR